MEPRILWDNYVLLDLFLLRTNENPYILEIEKFFFKKKIPIFLSSSQLHNLEFILKQHFKNLGIKINARSIIEKFFDTHMVFILKTPSYINFQHPLAKKDLEDYLIFLTAELFEAKILTRNEDFLNFLGKKGLHPGEVIEFIKNYKPSQISMLDLRKELICQYSIIEEYTDNVYRKCHFILGSEVQELEKKIADYIGSKYAIGVSSGTDALILSLRALAIKNKGKEYFEPEDLIITTPFTFTATGEAILRAGATPLFVDIDPDTYNLDPQEVKKAVKRFGKRIVGIIPVHLYGQACNMDEILRIARENELFIVEDCAQSFGAKWNKMPTGSFGDTGCFSFFPSKNLGSFGDGGAITTNDDKVAEIIYMLRKHGGKDKYNVNHIGYNARLDTLQAAILLARIKYIDDFNKKRQKIAKQYIEKLKDLSQIKLPKILEQSKHVFHQFTIQLASNLIRDKLQSFLKKQNISTAIYYPIPLHQMKVFQNRSLTLGNLYHASQLSQKVLSLPIGPLQSKQTTEYIINKIKDFLSILKQKNKRKKLQK